VSSTHTQPSLDQPVLQPDSSHVQSTLDQPIQQLDSSHDQSNQQSDSTIAQEYPLDQPVQQPYSTLIQSPPLLEEAIPPIEPSNTHTMTTRSKTDSLKPKSFPGYHLYYSTKHPPIALRGVTHEIEPSSYSKAASDSRWKEAMQQEFDALISNGTWSLCPRPQNHNVIHNKWVYRIKQKSDGTIDRFKASLVAKGFEQQSGIDYTETFSPVIKPSTIRILLALAVNFSWPIRQLDVSNAFLHGSLMEEVFMEQPQGFKDATHPQYVCKLHKAIYGLKQAPRAWFNRFSSFLLDIGFKASLVDSSLFLFHNGRIHLFMLIYVDDIIITHTHPAAVQSVILRLQQEFPVKDLGPLNFFLGIQVQCTGQGLHLCQAKYISDLFHRVRMRGAKPSKSPCPAGSKLSKFDGELLEDPTANRHIGGALQYCTLTRPDIAFSVNQLYQHIHAPTSSHWSAAKRILRYLKGTIDHGLAYIKGNLNLMACCDSYWAGSPDD
jgi:hypothetical protein